MKKSNIIMIVTLIMFLLTIPTILFVTPHYSILGYRVSLSDTIICCILIINCLYCGMLSGILLAVITPVISFVLTSSASITQKPLLLVCLMVGNAILVLGAWLVRGKKIELNVLPITLVVASIAKYAVVTLLLTYWLNTKHSYSMAQLYEALLATFFVCIAWPLLKLIVKR